MCFPAPITLDIPCHLWEKVTACQVPAEAVRGRAGLHSALGSCPSTTRAAQSRRRLLIQAQSWREETGERGQASRVQLTSRTLSEKQMLVAGCCRDLGAVVTEAKAD